MPMLRCYPSILVVGLFLFVSLYSSTSLVLQQQRNIRIHPHIPFTHTNTGQKKTRRQHHFLYSLSNANEKTQMPTSDIITLTSRIAWSPKMIVFDKDGTLGDCSPALRTWCTTMTAKIKEELQRVGTSLVEMEIVLAHFYTAIGWDCTNNEVLPSAPLAASTWESILDITSSVMAAHGFKSVSTKIWKWHSSLGDIHENDKPVISDLQGLMSYFRRQSMYVSLCTSDDRKATEKCIKKWKLEGLIDFSICGDEVDHGKPSPEPLHRLCKQAGVLPEDCIVVGDTSSDCGMGNNSGAGLVVGVLTGSGTRDQLLASGADVVLPNIGMLPQFCEDNGLTTSSICANLDLGSEHDTAQLMGLTSSQ